MIVGIIPARYSSSRFPGKPLAMIAGKTMIQRVYEQAAAAKKINHLVVATDDSRIFDHVKSFGGNVIMTAENHPSGTDRCYDCLQQLEEKFEYVINIQGDEPFLHPDQINEIAATCDGNAELITQMIPVESNEILFDYGEVKIVLNKDNEALYFSRNVIPFLKGVPENEWHKKHNYYRHVGLYAYRSDVLKLITQLKPSALEIAESLEQLRWLEAGFKIKCVTTSFESHCIDTPEDIEKVIRLMNIKTI
jgi:3-deoxy-manno-octulosonate cytidylyltransferase (CMP-KDO synthetase)